MTEYDNYSTRFMGILCIVMSLFFLFLTYKVPSLDSDEELDPKTQEQINKTVEHTVNAAYKIQLIVKRIIIGIIMFIVLLFILLDLVIIKQTIKSRNYINTVASYIGPETDEENGEFISHKYTFEDKQGNKHEITYTYSNSETPEETIKIKYDENNPENYYYEHSTYGADGIAWFIIKILIEFVLLFLFFYEGPLGVNISISN